MATIGYKERARRHKIKFREEVLKVDKGDYETFLNEAEAIQGLIFYNGFNIFDLINCPDFYCRFICQQINTTQDEIINLPE